MFTYSTGETLKILVPAGMVRFIFSKKTTKKRESTETSAPRTPCCSEPEESQEVRGSKRHSLKDGMKNEKDGMKSWNAVV